LTAGDKHAALASHSDFYEAQGDSVGPRIENGCFQINSINSSGYGFEVVPDIDQWTPAGDWDFSTLGLEE